MRRGGVNPTDVEMVSIINKHDNTSGYIDIKAGHELRKADKYFFFIFPSGVLLHHARGNKRGR